MLKRNNVWEYGEGLLQACISSIDSSLLNDFFNNEFLRVELIRRRGLSFNWDGV